MPEAQDRSTTRTRLVPDEGAPYRRLRSGPGEAHAVRTELLPAGQEGPADGPVRHLAGLVHLTDFQIADLASPSRLEFLQRRDGQPDWQRMLPAYRPQEFLLPHAIEATVRAVNAWVAAAPERWNLVLTTGDNTDSAQSNELAVFLGSLAGGPITPGVGTRDFADAPVGLGDENYWTPEPTPDLWKQERGLPTVPGALAASARPFEGVGLDLPWLSCFGNHDCLVQGRAAAPSGYDEFLVGTRKPVGSDLEPSGDVLAAYVEDPRPVSSGPAHTIEADPGRAMVSRYEYVSRHLAAPGLPTGHGFTTENLREDTAYYVHDDIPGVRLIVVDSTNPAGHVDGSLDDVQFRWLHDRLVEVHSEHRGRDGATVRTGNRDRVVVIASHHGTSTMTNAHGDQDGSRHLAGDVEALLHCFGNVVLWLSGHTHVHRVSPRPGPTGGFWEVSTGSIAEWPVQSRGVEIALAGDVLRIRTTVIDALAPAGPDGSLSHQDLAALHREVAANDDSSVGGLHAEGTPEDRNQDLLVPVSASLRATLEA